MSYLDHSDVPSTVEQLSFKYMVRSRVHISSLIVGKSELDLLWDIFFGMRFIFFPQEMCKVESSTDSDSEISPRWSDTSTLVF